MEKVYRALLERAQAAVDEAKKRNRRARELSSFVAALRKTTPAGIVRCAWCGNVAAGDSWIDPLPLLRDDLRERLRANASHSICPDCFERVTAEVARQRRA